MSGTLAAVESLVDSGDDADEVLRGVVGALVDGGATWAAVLFVEEGELVLGPEAGTPDPGTRSQVPVAYRGEPVGALVVDGDVDPATLARVAELLAPHVLLGWDTGGDPWEP